MKTPIAAVLLLAGLALAPWLGGHILMDPAPARDNYLIAVFSRGDAAGSQFIIALLVLASFFVAAVTRNVLQLPFGLFTGVLFSLWLWLAMSILSSEHKYASLLEFARWTTYIVALFACVTVLGRGSLLRAGLIAIFAGASAMALSGVYEFMQVSASAPNWRIFAGWQNPNAAAGLLAMALPLGLGLTMASKEKLERLLFTIGCAVCFAALWLTASKGGLLAAVFGILALALFGLFGRQFSAQRWRALVIAMLSAGILVAVISGVSRLAAGGAVAGSRLAASAQEGAQSVSFRRVLWEDTIDIIGSNPAFGTGLGTFPQAIKMHTQTQGSALAHQSYLQLGAEAGLPALIIFLLLGFLWLWAVLRKHPAAPPERSILRYGVTAAVIAGAANLFIESNLSYFGFSLTFFSLLGIGLLLAVDGVMPERAAFAGRSAMAGVFCIGALIVFAIAAYSSRQVAVAMASSSASEAVDRLNSAASVSPLDPLPHAQLSRIFTAQGNADSAIVEAQKAIKLGPTALRYTMLAEAQQLEGNTVAAKTAYSDAIEREPANPYFKRRYFAFLKEISDEQGAITAAEQLIESESSAFVRTSALPWLVNTDSIEARIYLADIAKRDGDLNREAMLLRGAVAILATYQRKTYQELLRLTGYADVIAAQNELSNSLGREPTAEELAEKLGTTPSELSETLDVMRKARLANESIEAAERKLALLHELGNRLIQVYTKLERYDEAEIIKRLLKDF